VVKTQRPPVTNAFNSDSEDSLNLDSYQSGRYTVITLPHPFLSTHPISPLLARWSLSNPLTLFKILHKVL
jgi:hypothetical protein